MFDQLRPKEKSLQDKTRFCMAIQETERHYLVLLYGPEGLISSRVHAVDKEDYDLVTPEMVMKQVVKKSGRPKKVETMEKELTQSFSAGDDLI